MTDDRQEILDTMPLDRTYRQMTIPELQYEMEMWQEVADEPKGPGGASNGARLEAIRQMHLAEAWVKRKKNAAKGRVPRPSAPETGN